MCNDYEQHVAYANYATMMARLDLGVPSGEGPSDLPPADDVRISDTAPIIRVQGNGVALAPMRWGFPPPRPKASPVFNFRSEGRHFKLGDRCLVPASAFFEFTGAKSPKAKHRFTLASEPFLAIAGLWRQSDSGPHFTMLTTSPGPDIEPYHDRQVVVLRPELWSDWLTGASPEEDLLTPLPAGSLEVVTVRPGAR